MYYCVKIRRQQRDTEPENETVEEVTAEESPYSLGEEKTSGKAEKITEHKELVYSDRLGRWRILRRRCSIFLQLQEV